MNDESRVLLREARPDDEEALTGIIRNSFRHGIYTFFATRSLRSAPKVIVSDVDAKAVGFAEPLTVTVDDKKIGNILWIAIHPDYRRRGVASALVDECVRYLSEQGVDEIFISVERDNQPAFGLFEPKGFRRVGRSEIHARFGLKSISFYGKLMIAPHEVVLVRSRQALREPSSI